MKIQPMSKEEFEKTAASMQQHRQFPGSNVKLLRDAETEPVKLTFPTDEKALYKATALYTVRKRGNFQVRMVRQNNCIYLGPGDYFPALRVSRKSR